MAAARPHDPHVGHPVQTVTLPGVTRPGPTSAAPLPNSVVHPASPTFVNTPTGASKPPVVAHSSSAAPSHNSSAIVPATSSDSHVSTGAVVGIVLGALAAVILFVGYRIVRYMRRKRPAVPFPPVRPYLSARFPDRHTLARSVYVLPEHDGIEAMTSLANYAHLMPTTSIPTSVFNTPDDQSSHVSSFPQNRDCPTPDTSYLTPSLHLPHTRSPTEATAESWNSASATSTQQLISPLHGTSGSDIDEPGSPPFGVPLTHQSSGRSMASSIRNSSPSSQMVPLPSSPPVLPSSSSTTSTFTFPSTTLSASPIPPANTSSRPQSVIGRAQRRSVRPVSYAASISSRHSVYSVAGTTIRGAPHAPHNRVEIVLPTPLAPESYPYGASLSHSYSSASSINSGAGHRVRSHSEHQSYRSSAYDRQGRLSLSLTGHGDFPSFDGVSEESPSMLTPGSNPFETHFHHPLADPPPVPPLPPHLLSSLSNSMAGSSTTDLGYRSTSTTASASDAPGSSSSPSSHERESSSDDAEQSTPLLEQESEAGQEQQEGQLAPSAKDQDATGSTSVSDNPEG